MDGRGATFGAQGFLLIDRLVSDEWCARVFSLFLLPAGLRWAESADLPSGAQLHG